MLALINSQITQQKDDWDQLKAQLYFDDGRYASCRSYKRIQHDNTAAQCRLSELSLIPGGTEEG